MIRTSFKRLFCLLALSALLPGFVSAAQPSLGGTSPRGGQRGTELVVDLQGARLEDAQEVLFYEPGIEVTKLEAPNGSVVKATLKIAADAPLGNHRLRVRTKSGVTELRPFSVGALPEVAEKEPNSEFATPQAVPMNCTVNGVADNEDVDYYVIDAKKGDRISAEVEGIRLGITLFDVYVAIMNAGRFELASSDDAALVYQDGIASIIAPEDGKYIIQVRESSYAGNGACLYRVHIGNFPRPMATIPSGGKAGEATQVKFLGDILGEKTESITLPGASDNFAVFAKDQFGISPSGIPFRVTNLGNVVELEPNDEKDDATEFIAPIALNGVIEKPGDNDNFSFDAKKGQVFDVRVHARSLRSPLDSVLTIMAAGSNPTPSPAQPAQTAGRRRGRRGGNVRPTGLGSNDDSAGPDSYMRFAAPADGEYIINVRDHLGNGGPYYAYRVEVTPVQPKLVLSANEFQQYVPVMVNVPAGGRVGVVLSAARYDFGGPLGIRGDNLPAGVTIDTPAMTAGMSIAPVIFQAPADAPLSGKLSEIVGFLNDPMRPMEKIEGKVSQPIAMVRGQNNIPFRIEPTESLPVVVSEALPFDIAIVEPKVPLVRGGQMELKVVATRKPDFKAAIKIDMLWVPPGLGASGSISIPEGQNEATIPMNAAGNAELQTWKIAVRGQAAVGNATRENCTPFANLRIAEAYLTLAYEQAAVEQAKETELVVHMTKTYDFPGSAKVSLIGLPNKAVTEVQEITKDTKDIVFKIKTDMTTPAGNHQNLFCQVVVMENNEPVVHNIGTGKLRVDVPLPPKKDAPPPPPMPAAAPAAPAPVAAAPPKRLTRLEQLRLEQEQRDKARKEGTAPAAPAAPAAPK